MRFTRPMFRAAAVVLAVSAAGLVISLQGWKAREPNLSEVVYAMHQALEIVEHGTVPDRGVLTDFGSYYPPGTAWLMVPAVLLTADVRLVDVVSSALLYAGAISAVYAVGVTMFGAGPALLAAIVYAFSYIALVFSSDLWPRAHPTFYVWMVYFAVRWITQRDGRAPAAAFLAWAAGMYFYLELAPAILALPALWLVYRPPVNWKMLAASAGVAAIIWQPFLAFQWDKNFVDLKSQLLRQPVWAQHNPLQQPMPPLAFEWRSQFLPGGFGGFTDTLTGNLQTRVPGGDFVLLGLLLGGLTMSVAGPPSSHRRKPAAAGGRSANAAVAAATVVAAGVLVNECLLRWVAAGDMDLEGQLVDVRRLQVWLLIGVAIVAGLHPAARSALAALRPHWRPDVMPVVIALLVPWLALLLAVEGGRPDRAFAFWPLQALLIAACADACARRPGGRPAVRWLVPLVVVLIVGANNYSLFKVRDWREHGWAGAGPDFLPIPPPTSP